ncbi:MFS transporter [Mycobacterium ostraviense]|uniref:MFS transporter n=1 Tax=Mycobacterium ostraviense TaxID=2738409 RepID=UPI0009E2DAF9|nr:MFS transporter [Mycobacterium ostraviense]UGT92122.1 MFS transporter [Mycobacterium ostraviense]
MPDSNTSPHSSGEHGFPGVIWLLLGGNLVVRAAGFAYPFMAFHVAGRGHAAGAVGAVLAAFGVGWAVGQLTCGWLVDRTGPRATLASTMLVAATVLVLMAQAGSVPALLIGALVTGVVYDAPRPVLGAAIAELVPDPGRRAKIDAWRFGWIVSIGRAITGGVGGLLAGWSGVPVLFWINAVACAMLALLAVCCIRAREHRRSPAVTQPADIGYRGAFSDARLVLLLGSSLATLTAVRGLYAAVPMLMADSGLGAGEFGWAQLANAVAGIGLTPVMTPWLGRKAAARFRPRLDILAVAGVWTAVSMSGAALAHTTLGFTVATAVCTPGEIAWFVIAAGIVHRIAPPANGGRYHGVWSMTLAIASVVAPILASYSLIHGGHRLVAIVTVTVGLTGAALCLPLARTLGRSTSVPVLSHPEAVPLCRTRHVTGVEQPGLQAAPR